jgi:hypothetical protein
LISTHIFIQTISAVKGILTHAGFGLAQICPLKSQGSITQPPTISITCEINGVWQLKTILMLQS